MSHTPTTPAMWQVAYGTIANKVDNLPKATIMSLLLIIFSIDYIIGASFRPWWDIAMFTIASSNVLIYLIIYPLTKTMSSIDFYTAFGLMAMKLLYLLNYVVRESHVPSFLIGLVCGMLAAGVPAALDYYFKAKTVYDTTNSLSSVFSNPDTIGDLLGGMGTFFNSVTKSMQPKTQVPHNLVLDDEIEDEDNPEDLDDAVNSALGGDDAVNADLGGEDAQTPD